MDTFAHVATLWNRMTIDKPNMIFAVVKMDVKSELAELFEIDSCPSLVFLPESHPISPV